MTFDAQAGPSPQGEPRFLWSGIVFFTLAAVLEIVDLLR
jgi:hypothetical protein